MSQGTPLIPDEVYDRLVENTSLADEVGVSSRRATIQTSVSNVFVAKGL